MSYKMGFHGLIYYGVADGATTATTLITNSRDISITPGHKTGDTTTRGDGTTPPPETKQVTGRTWSCDFQMLEKTDDTTLEALKVAAAAGSAVAFRMIDYSGGKGFDGDVIVSQKSGKPLDGNATIDFTVEPTDVGRLPQTYV